MATPVPTTIDEYIASAPPQAQAHLRQLRALLKRVAPQAQEAIKWGTPFFIEPRFLFGFSAHKAHLSFAASASTLLAFRDELAPYRTTKELLHLPYDQPLPEALLQRMAEYRLRIVSARTDDSFW